jgi:glycosyltransferase involved in cell wall biosynthesis
MTGEDIDVVIPVRDGAAFLAEAIRSALAQGPAVAVTVVDDGSTDGSADVAAACGPAVRVLRQPPTGAAAARNRGLAASDRPLVAFLDADDRMPEGSIEVRHRALQDGSDAVSGRIVEFADPALADRLKPREGPLDGLFLGATLLRRDAFTRVGPFSETLAAGDFIDWVSRARQAGVRFRAIADIVLERRLHARNMTRDRSLIGRDYLTVLRRHLGRAGQDR